MPHKHKRKRDDDFSNFDLAPSTHAKPLAAFNKASIFSKTNDAPSNKRRKPNLTKQSKLQDDTPKAFARLMTWQATGKKPNGLDDGSKPSKKQSKKSQPKSQPEDSTENTHTSESASQSTSTVISTPTQSIPKILPGETLSSFNLRVDQSLPLTSITRSTNPQSLPADLAARLKKSQRTTKHNKRLQRMQADWRTEETKLRDKEDEERDEHEDQKEEEDLLWAGVKVARNGRKGKKKRAGKEVDDDPWQDLEKKRREETKQRSLQDVVKAPPVLKTVKSKFKTRAEDFKALDGRGQRKSGADLGDDALVDVSNVPNAVGSLRRREELNATRRAVIEGYRKLHGRKRGVGERLNLSKASTM